MCLCMCLCDCVYVSFLLIVTKQKSTNILPLAVQDKIVYHF